MENTLEDNKEIVLDKEIVPSEEIALSEELLLSVRELLYRVHQLGTMPFAELTMLISLRRLTRAKGYAGPTELKKELKLSTPAVSRMLHTLRDKGYISRDVSAEDHRFVKVRITEKGDEYLERELARYRKVFGGIAGQMGTEKLLIFLGTVREFTEILQEEIGKLPRKKGDTVR